MVPFFLRATRDDFLLGHFAVEAAEGAFDQAEVADFSPRLILQFAIITLQFAMSRTGFGLESGGLAGGTKTGTHHRGTEDTEKN